jgi:hypothetical protein
VNRSFIKVMQSSYNLFNLMYKLDSTLSSKLKSF